MGSSTLSLSSQTTEELFARLGFGFSALLLISIC